MTPEQLAALRYADLTEHQKKVMRAVRANGWYFRGTKFGKNQAAIHLRDKGILRESTDGYFVPTDARHPIWQEVQAVIDEMDRTRTVNKASTIVNNAT